ncbi:hypothetical protein BRARA_B01455 [Brassica rapa]|uniref:Uncharacterized protein n=1 Tax=Brassica campestris TaxID=3711 RepID=A0A398A930_BRACM|nr:hypothetical protein BRARA_B01455 [Brassica rapa]
MEKKNRTIRDRSLLRTTKPHFLLDAPTHTTSYHLGARVRQLDTILEYEREENGLPYASYGLMRREPKLQILRDKPNILACKQTEMIKTRVNSKPIYT